MPMPTCRPTPRTISFSRPTNQRPRAKKCRDNVFHLGTSLARALALLSRTILRALLLCLVRSLCCAARVDAVHVARDGLLEVGARLRRLGVAAQLAQAVRDVRDGQLEEAGVLVVALVAVERALDRGGLARGLLVAR